MKERVYKTDAVILRRVEFRESDFLITAFSREYGKLKGIAKGARKPLSRRTGHVELHSLTHLVIHAGQDLEIIAQAEVKNHFAALHADLERSYLASHFAELLDQFAYEGEANPQAFDLIVQAWGWLEDLSIDHRLVGRYFEYRLLRVMGYEPSLFRCVISDAELPAADQYFCFSEGGMVLPQHTAGLDVMLIPLPVFKVLRHFARSPWEQVKSLQLSDDHYQTLERVLHQYLTYILERGLKSATLLNKLTKKNTL